jgi:putative ABC transport system permease protein
MSWGAVRALVAFGPPDLPRLAELHFSPLVVLFVVAVALAAVAVCTFVPTIRLRAQARSINLRDGGRGETAGRARQRIRSAIAGGQLAVALVVIAGSMLLLRTFQRYHDERPGFAADNVITAWTQLPFARYGDSASVAFYGRLTESIARLPGVASVGVTSRLPLGDGDTQELTFLNDEGRSQSVPVIATDGSYFAAMTIPLLTGRTFQPLGQQRDGEIILSRRAAKVFFGDDGATSATGRRLSLGPAALPFTVIGVVDDVRDHDLGTPPAPTVYTAQAVPTDLAVQPAARRTMALVIKTTGSPNAVVASIRRTVGEIDANVPVFNVELMSDVVRASTARLSFLLAMMSAAAVITLLLGAIGLYGVMAYMVALRTRELGIRIALGADPRQVARGVVQRALAVVGAGVLAGLVLYAVVTPFLRGFLYGVTAADPVTIGGAVVALIATACVAAWLPARRAGRVDPAVALRAE